METLLKKRMIDVVLVQPLVEGRTGEIRVTLRNPNPHVLAPGLLRVRESGAGAPRFVIVPSADEGGYRIDELPESGWVQRTFCLRQVDAQVGIQSDLVVSFESDHAPPVEAVFSVRTEARSEIYAAIGAVEWLRTRMLAAYDELEETGRQTHEQMGGVWPANDAIDPARVLLGEESFRRVFEMVQLGARMIEGVAKKGNVKVKKAKAPGPKSGGPGDGDR